MRNDSSRSLEESKRSHSASRHNIREKDGLGPAFEHLIHGLAQSHIFEFCNVR
jgi:hypothetical protein